MNYDKLTLEYQFDDLEPYIDKETVCIHYTKHLQNYVDKLNMVLAGHEDFTSGKTLEEILYYPEKIPQDIKKDFINQSGGVVNHNLYFSILSKEPKTTPSGKLLDAIEKKYGTLEILKNELSNKAIYHFGSGYSFLVVNEQGDLEVVETNNQDSPLIMKMKPILAIDVWEHAYYLKYKNLRAEYVNNLWNVIDWSKVEDNYLKSLS